MNHKSVIFFSISILLTLWISCDGLPANDEKVTVDDKKDHGLLVEVKRSETRFLHFNWTQNLVEKSEKGFNLVNVVSSTKGFADYEKSIDDFSLECNKQIEAAKLKDKFLLRVVGTNEWAQLSETESKSIKEKIEGQKDKLTNHNLIDFKVEVIPQKDEGSLYFMAVKFDALYGKPKQEGNVGVLNLDENISQVLEETSAKGTNQVTLLGKNYQLSVKEQNCAGVVHALNRQSIHLIAKNEKDLKDPCVKGSRKVKPSDLAKPANECVAGKSMDSIKNRDETEIKGALDYSECKRVVRDLLLDRCKEEFATCFEPFDKKKGLPDLHFMAVNIFSEEAKKWNVKEDGKIDSIDVEKETIKLCTPTTPKTNEDDKLDDSCLRSMYAWLYLEKINGFEDSDFNKIQFRNITEETLSKGYMLKEASNKAPQPDPDPPKEKMSGFKTAIIIIVVLLALGAFGYLIYIKKDAFMSMIR